MMDRAFGFALNGSQREHLNGGPQILLLLMQDNSRLFYGTEILN